MQQRLQQRLRAARENEGGFTLIELLIVIVILGILAGIVVFSVQFVQARGQVAACKTDYKTVQAAVEAYYAQNSSYPSAVADAVPPAPTDPTTLVGAGVLKQAPNSPNYTIVYSGAATHTVTATGLAGCP